MKLQNLVRIMILEITQENNFKKGLLNDGTSIQKFT